MMDFMLTLQELNGFHDPESDSWKVPDASMSVCPYCMEPGGIGVHRCPSCGRWWNCCRITVGGDETYVITKEPDCDEHEALFAHVAAEAGGDADAELL